MKDETTKNENCMCHDSEPIRTTAEDELLWAKIRIDELREELNAKEKKIDEEQKKNCVLVDCLSYEHTERKNAFREIEYSYRRIENYRNAINEIAEKCHRVLKVGKDASVETTVEQLAKEIFDITYRF
jgi:hypothetical protein